MRYVSLFSGIEAASAAWKPLGWEPVAFAEIEPFPCAVLEERFPEVPNLGDVTKVDWKEWNGSCDLVIGGSPCQSFSLAGLRKGLADPRGNLMLEYLRACRDIGPEWIVWENVPGVLSADGRRAFQAFLEAVVELWPRGGVCWRVLDAQFFGVAQRRRRVFAVVNTRDWRRAAAVLLEPDCLRGNPESSKEKRKALAAASGGGAARSYTLKLRHTGSENRGGGQGPLVFDDVSATLATSQDQTLFAPDVLAFKHRQGASARGVAEDGETSPTLTADWHQPAVLYGIAGNVIGRADESGGHQLGVCDPDENGFYTLDTADRHAVAFAANQRGEARLENGDGGVVCMADDNGRAAVDEDACGTLKANGHAPIAAGRYVVRRLTPTECERLQGFPDGWTRIPYRNKPAEECPDGPRYKALGNSMAVPAVRWIGERIDMVDELVADLMLEDEL